MTSDKTMVEEMARAMAKADGKDPDAPAWIRYPSGQTEGVCWRDQYADKAQAAATIAQRRVEELREALFDWRNCWLCPVTNFEDEVSRLLTETDALIDPDEMETHPLSALNQKAVS